MNGLFVGRLDDGEVAVPERLRRDAVERPEPVSVESSSAGVTVEQADDLRRARSAAAELARPTSDE